MPSKQAKVLTPKQFDQTLRYAKAGDHPERDEVVLQLSFKAGLRAAEIAGLDWQDVCDAEGTIGIVADADLPYFRVPSDISKSGRDRTLPMHPDLKVALGRLRATRPNDAAIVHGLKPKHPRVRPGALRMYMYRMYKRAGMSGCSSHSGRRTFITKLARQANLHDCSLRDVQLLAGHQSIVTTEKYIDVSKSVASLVRSV